MRKNDTIFFETPPVVTAFAVVAGKKEGEGPLGDAFDEKVADTKLGQKTWEQAEAALQQRAMARALAKGRRKKEELDMVFSGDLENQTTASAYTQREIGAPHLGLYGACSTMALGLGLAACAVGAGMAGVAAAMTSSHFCAAERVFRFPLGYGGKRTPTSQWTATAAGCVLVEKGVAPPFIRAVTFGRVQDLGVTDANNMGAAMAPAAAATLGAFFRDSGTGPDAYDHIFTGDLGAVGSRCLLELLEREQGLGLPNHQDCGLLLYDREVQRVQAGGSGCGCSAAVLCAHILPAIRAGKMKNVLFVATGALMSPTLVQQGESIPGIAHLVQLTGQ